MDLERFREYCIGLGEVTEKMPFGKFAKRYDSILAFYTMGHMFCFIDIDDFTWVNVKSLPDEIANIRDRFQSVGNPLNQSLRYWIRLDFDGDIPDEEIFRLVKRGYEIVEEKYSKKKDQLK